MDTYGIQRGIKAIFSIVMIIGFICFGLFGWNKLKAPKEVTTQYKTVGIMLSNGHKISAEVTKGEGKIFIPQDTLSEILGKNVQWNKDDETLYIGQVPNAQIMSQQVDMLFHSKAINSIYSSRISTDKMMTMGGKTFNLGYSFKNISKAEFALNGNYEKLRATLGVQDNTCWKEGLLEVYLDDQLYKTFNISPDKLPQNMLLEVKGANQMSLVFKNFDEDAVINLADVYIK